MLLGWVLGHVLIKFFINYLKKSIRTLLMRVMYPNWKVPYRPNNREKFGMSGKKISCLWFGIVFIIWQNLKKKQQVQKWNFNSVRFFFLNQCENDQEKMVTEGIDNWDVRRGLKSILDLDWHYWQKKFASVQEEFYYRFSTFCFTLQKHQIF